MAVTSPHQGESSREPAPGELRLVQRFVNTLDSDDGLRQVETLNRPADLERWLRDHDLLERGARIGARELRRAIELRQALRALLLANTSGAAVDARTVAALNSAADRAPAKVSFDADGNASLVGAARGLDAAMGRVLAAVVQAMADGTWARLKACPNPDCEWAFYDRSRNRSSRWCAMSECGNRAKVRALRERRRAAT
jgi:predicted RNA-binding Zn ribbon-like protein